MNIKVCGINNQQIQEVDHLDVDMIGLNFYPQSKRFVKKKIATNTIGSSLVGVFVNSTMDNLRKKANTYDLDFLQLHGDESIEYCIEAKEIAQLIKVFRITEVFNFEQVKAYENHVAYFLFDTYTPKYGGSGLKFDWKVLANYTGNTPFLLSGGIGPEDAEMLQAIKHENFWGIDLNSKFELAPANKDLYLLENFIKEIHG